MGSATPCARRVFCRWVRGGEPRSKQRVCQRSAHRALDDEVVEATLLRQAPHLPRFVGILQVVGRIVEGSPHLLDEILPKVAADASVGEFNELLLTLNKLGVLDDPLIYIDFGHVVD